MWSPLCVTAADLASRRLVVGPSATRPGQAPSRRMPLLDTGSARLSASWEPSGAPLGRRQSGCLWPCGDGDDLVGDPLGDVGGVGRGRDEDDVAEACSGPCSDGVLGGVGRRRSVGRSSDGRGRRARRPCRFAPVPTALLGRGCVVHYGGGGLVGRPVRTSTGSTGRTRCTRSPTRCTSRSRSTSRGRRGRWGRRSTSVLPASAAGPCSRCWWRCARHGGCASST